MNYNYFERLTAFLLLCALTGLLNGCSASNTPISKTGFYFDTVISISIYDSDDSSLLEHCFSLADHYENMLSKTREGSDIWNINHANGLPVTVSDDTLTLLNTALCYSEISNGGIDPTIGSVSELWDFSGTSSSHSLPLESDLREALSHVNYKLISIAGNAVTLEDSQAHIDLGFIAKGFIADKMKEYLLAQGVKSGIINLGGNVLTIGCKPDGSPFQVGIQEPFAASGVSAVTLPVTNLSVVSSGIYERCFTLEGELYHHILDTKTGYPIRNNLSEVTILSESSMDGDALSTTCFVLGLDKSIELIESLENTEALFITEDGNRHTTSGLSLP